MCDRVDKCCDAISVLHEAEIRGVAIQENNDILLLCAAHFAEIQDKDSVFPIPEGVPAAISYCARRIPHQTHAIENTIAAAIDFANSDDNLLSLIRILAQKCDNTTPLGKFLTLFFKYTTDSYATLNAVSSAAEAPDDIARARMVGEIATRQSGEEFRSDGDLILPLEADFRSNKIFDASVPLPPRNEATVDWEIAGETLLEGESGIFGWETLATVIEAVRHSSAPRYTGEFLLLINTSELVIPDESQEYPFIDLWLGAFLTDEEQNITVKYIIPRL